MHGIDFAWAVSHHWYLKPEWMIVWVTVAYTIASILTLLAIRSQAADARESASLAATANAETLTAIRCQADTMAVQAAHMESQVKLMDRQITEAAAATHKTLTLQFRPKIVIRGGEVGGGDFILFTFTNTGGSNAIFQRCKIGVTTLSLSGTYHSLIEALKDQLSEGFTLPPGEIVMVQVPIELSLLQQINVLNTTAREIPNATFKRTIYCVGAIRYRDEIGITRGAEIMRWYEPKATRFEIIDRGDRDYSD